ncbi:hypothetical protein, partial [uncultured Methanoculleus sp.]|uniref:hypothetical protein n=1 Tax=uncultured Methanoculleus sp. TaxID=183762 RepID=UPI003204DD9E
MKNNAFRNHPNPAAAAAARTKNGCEGNCSGKTPQELAPLRSERVAPLLKERLLRTDPSDSFPFESERVAPLLKERLLRTDPSDSFPFESERVAPLLKERLLRTDP